jgi:hypothetical protein
VGAGNVAGGGVACQAQRDDMIRLNIHDRNLPRSVVTTTWYHWLGGLSYLRFWVGEPKGPV